MLPRKQTSICDTPIAAEMNVNNSQGTLQALNGSINIRSAAYDAPFNTTVTGGDLLSKEVNAYTGGGTTNVFVKELTGIINTSGTAAHVSADTADLTIGNQCLVGDPTYYNTGNIIIGGDIIVGETLAIIAGGNITTNQTSLIIEHATFLIMDAISILLPARTSLPEAVKLARRRTCNTTRSIDRDHHAKYNFRCKLQWRLNNRRRN